MRRVSSDLTGRLVNTTAIFSTEAKVSRTQNDPHRHISSFFPAPIQNAVTLFIPSFTYLPHWVNMKKDISDYNS